MNKTDNKPVYIKIVYKDAQDKLRDAVIRLPECSYITKVTYRERVDRAVTNIIDEGGFWLNETTVIPAHRIMSFHTLEEKQENPQNKTPNKRRPRRGKKKISENNVRKKDPLPRNTSSSK